MRGGRESRQSHRPREDFHEKGMGKGSEKYPFVKKEVFGNLVRTILVRLRNTECNG